MLTLQFGQCGNQLGYELFSKIMKDIQCPSPGISFKDSYEYIENSNSKWFEGLSKNKKHFARAILIDTEHKVINKIMNKNDKGWCFKPENIITPESSAGSANNWSYGYLKKGPELINSILEATRKELERADKLDTFFCLLSCAGGTGSGLGSYTIQTLRDTFPTKNIISTLVFPFGFGEVTTQNYNTVLSLARIVQDTDMIIILENESLYKELSLSSYSRPSKSVNEIAFPNDLNDIACQKLLSVFQPAEEITSGNSNKNSYMISRIVPHPAYKLTTIEAVPLLSQHDENLLGSSWQSQFKSLKRNLSSNFTNFDSKSYNSNINAIESTNNIHSLANILLTRGSCKLKSKNKFNSCYTDDPKLYNDLLTQKDIYTTTNWLSSTERFIHFHQKRRLFNTEKFSSVLTNNSRIHKSLDKIINRAWSLYTYGAFLHQYKAHGLEDDDFLRAFAKNEYLNDTYKKL